MIKVVPQDYAGVEIIREILLKTLINMFNDLKKIMDRISQYTENISWGMKTTEKEPDRNSRTKFRTKI